MSFRNTFVTDFIYQAGDKEMIEATKALTEVFERLTTLKSKIDKRGYGYYAGTISSLDGSMCSNDIQLEKLVYELEKITKVPFRITFLLESNAQITFNVSPTLA